MKKTLTTVVAAGLLTTASVAQDAGQKQTPPAGQAKSQGAEHKQAREGKVATKPGTASGEKTNNPDIKPARQGEKVTNDREK